MINEPFSVYKNMQMRLKSVLKIIFERIKEFYDNKYMYIFMQKLSIHKILTLRAVNLYQAPQSLII